MRYLILALLLSACSSCAMFMPKGQSASEQYDAMVLVRTTCPSGSVQQGTGILVSDDRVLTASHVVQCEVVPGIPMFQPPVSIEVHATKKDMALAKVELSLGEDGDVSRLKLANKSLAKFATEVVVGPPPTIGDTVCTVAAVPRPAYKCGVAQEQVSGKVLVEVMIEHGNSGGPMYDSRGRLIGIVTNLIKCENDAICAGWGTSLTGYAWLVPTE